MRVPSVAFHHTAIVVTDIERSIAFYGQHFAAVLEMQLRHVGGRDVAALHRLAEVDFDLAFLAIGGGRLELFEFHVPRSTTDNRSASSFGLSHVAFEVDDLHARYSEMRELGVHFTAPPLELSDDTAPGFVIAFCSDPDGNQVELLQTPA